MYVVLYYFIYLKLINYNYKLMPKSIVEDLNLGQEWDYWFASDKLKARTDPKFIKNKESYYFILNCFENIIEFCSNSVKEVLGYDSSEFTLAKVFSIIHPDDLPYCNRCESENKI